MKKKTSDFFYEAMMLKSVPRSGWLTIGIKTCESVADHSFGSALIGWILAKKEGADEEKVIKMCLLHDLPEARTGDVHKLASLYIKKDEHKAFNDAVAGVFCHKELSAVYSEYREKKTIEARCAWDADALDLLAQAKCYIDEGNKYPYDWIKSANKKISTKTGKAFARELEKTDSRAWIFYLKWLAGAY